MAKHMRFYDEVCAPDGLDDADTPAAAKHDGRRAKQAPGSPMELKIEADSPSGSPEGTDAGGDLYRSIKGQSWTARWLCLLFIATLVLFLFQLLLGWASRAVTLIADSAHSGADVISYGFNLAAEWLKFSARGRSRDKVTAKSMANVTRLVDTVGSFVSLLTLLFATVFAGLEATERLQAPTTEDSGKIGVALLVFAIISTVVNVGLLFMYRLLQRRGQKGSKQTTEVNAAKPSVPAWRRFTPTRILRRKKDTTVFSKEVPDPYFMDDLETSSKSDPEPEPAAIADLEENAIASPAAQSPWHASFTYCPPCKIQCVIGKSGPVAVLAAAPEGDAVDAPTDAEDASKRALAAMHAVIHPGCNCGNLDLFPEARSGEAGDTETAAEDQGSGKQGSAALVRKVGNLNLIAATVHLVTDLLRSLLILLVALLIQTGAVSDAEYTDAICALIVAFLICIGSAALLLRLSIRAYNCLNHFVS